MAKGQNKRKVERHELLQRFPSILIPISDCVLEQAPAHIVGNSNRIKK